MKEIDNKQKLYLYLQQMNAHFNVYQIIISSPHQLNTYVEK